jgi:transcriptional regulator with GAF, ATPase, and Fis domain
VHLEYSFSGFFIVSDARLCIRQAACQTGRRQWRASFHEVSRICPAERPPKCGRSRARLDDLGQGCYKDSSPRLPDDFPSHVRRSESRVSNIHLRLSEEGIDLEEVEKEILLQALEKHGWNQTHTAKYLNITRKTLAYRMDKFALSPPTSQSAG